MAEWLKKLRRSRDCGPTLGGNPTQQATGGYNLILYLFSFKYWIRYLGHPCSAQLAKEHGPTCPSGCIQSNHSMFPTCYSLYYRFYPLVRRILTLQNISLDE
jgi:hypothetical protein